MALTSRMWLSAGVFCLGVSIVLGYHEDQVVANNALAEKVKIPPSVMLQDFIQARHSNILNEVQLLGEAGLAQIITTNMGTETEPNWVQVLPFYPVGAQSLPFAHKYFADKAPGPRRPMPRVNRDALADAARMIAPLEDKPMGMILIEAGMSIEDAVLTQRIGVGAQGPLVAVSGALVHGEGLQSAFTGLLNEHGLWVMSDVPLIAPYASGLRNAGPAINYDDLRNWMEWSAVALILVGFANAVGLFARLFKAPVKTETAFQQVEATAAFPGVFQAIRTQEDLIREEQEASERAASAKRRTLSRINYG